jgi:hypothetical protein
LAQAGSIFQAHPQPDERISETMLRDFCATEAMRVPASGKLLEAGRKFDCMPDWKLDLKALTELLR